MHIKGSTFYKFAEAAQACRINHAIKSSWILLVSGALAEAAKAARKALEEAAKAAGMAWRPSRSGTGI